MPVHTQTPRATGGLPHAAQTAASPQGVPVAAQPPSRDGADQAGRGDLEILRLFKHFEDLKPEL